MKHGPFEYDHPSLVVDARTDSVTVPFRKLICAHYHTCLDCAVHNRWNSWHCSGCEVEEKLPADQLYFEMMSLLELFCEILNPGHLAKGDVSIERIREMAKEYQ